MSFEARGNALLDVLDELETSGFTYVLVGGYAVSAFNSRFSTDLDIVVAAADEGRFADFLTERGFDLQTTHDAEVWIDDRRVRQYEKRLGPTEPIGFDLLVNGLGCRQTEAEWSFDYLYRHSSAKEVTGGSRVATARVVHGDVLAAVKLHSARDTDLRDVVAIVPEIRFDSVAAHLDRGVKAARREQFQKAVERLESDTFDHGYKSEFGTSVAAQHSVRAVTEFLEAQIQRLT